MSCSFPPAPFLQTGAGAHPPYPADARKPVRPGESKGAFIWPRDRRMGSTPLSSWQRWKDVLSGKGPPVYVGDRTKYGPTRPSWSGWTLKEFDNLGWWDEGFGEVKWPADGKYYDFRTRRWTKDPFRKEVWSDVRWGKDKHIPLYYRDGLGMEWTKRNGRVLPFDNTEYGNDLRFRPHMPARNWRDPWPRQQWEYLDN